ncbi:MAG: MerR family transcriptional regulator [Actinomycetota bacterium]
MRVSDLSRHAGLAVATVKYYLREGLLDPGTATAATQATYGDEHLRRLRLIRALTDLGGLSLRQVHTVIDALEEADPLGALRALDARFVAAAAAGTDRGSADDEVDTFIDGELGWKVGADAPGRRLLADVLVAVRGSGRDVDVAIFRPYARAAGWLVTEDLEAKDVSSGPHRAERTVVATLAADAASIALRHLAREHLGSGRADRDTM